MINFKPEWAKHMDGAKFVAKHVPAIQVRMYNDDLLDDVVGLGGAIDQTLALVCQDATNTADAVGHLSYVIEQLGRARAAMLSEIE